MRASPQPYFTKNDKPLLKVLQRLCAAGLVLRRYGYQHIYNLTPVGMAVAELLANRPTDRLRWPRILHRLEKQLCEPLQELVKSV